jgi:IS30 family transposase
MISIEERPKEVEDRTIPGHWEGDLIIGKGHQSALGTLVERTTRFVILVPLKAKDATTVRKAFARELKRLPKQVCKSMTYDQGTEMSEHKLFTKETKIKVYFAHPHSPWERGTNENTNMLIRDFFPKGTDFREVSRYKIKKVQELLNTRPRKVLNWKFPGDVFANILQDSG